MAARSLAGHQARGRAAARAVVFLAAIAAGVVVMLLRIAGRPPLDTIYAEDNTVFLPWALAHPWHLLVPYAGYLQLLPRILAQLAALLPLRDAATALAISGAVIASGVAVFAWHAAAGHIRSGGLRALLAAAILLLSVAPLEIADSGVNTPWYLLFALFWAALWRPRTRAGMALAALIGFLTAASNPLAIVFAPLLAIRVAALRQVREHAVTAGWAAGMLLQLPVIHAAPRSRLGQLAPPGRAVAFYLHDVVLRLPGWRLSWQLEGALGRNGATVLAGTALAVLIGAVMVRQPAQVRMLAAAAIGTGFLLAVTGATVTWWVGLNPVHQQTEPGSRYTTLPIFLLQATLIAAVDAVLSRARARRRPAPGTAAPDPQVPGTEAPEAGRRVRPYAAAAAVLVLVAGLGAGWVTDFRNSDGRGGALVWAPVAAEWLAACQDGQAGDSITVNVWELGDLVIPCANLRR